MAVVEQCIHSVGEMAVPPKRKTGLFNPPSRNHVLLPLPTLLLFPPLEAKKNHCPFFLRLPPIVFGAKMYVCIGFD